MRYYAYRVTKVTGTQIGKTKVGEYMMETEYRGNGSTTWTIYNFEKPDWPVVATITGRYAGQVYREGDKLTEESRSMLREWEEAHALA